MPPKIQLKHSHGPIMIIVEFLPEIEQLKLHGLNKDFYDKVIPGIQRSFSNLKTFFFFEFGFNRDNKYGLVYHYVTKKGSMI